MEFNLSNLGRFVLITVEEVLFHAPTSQTCDTRQLEQAIIIAEERFIKKAICKDFYEAFRTAKNLVITTGNKATYPDTTEGDVINSIELVTDAWYKKLWNEYLWKIIAECVMYTASPTNYSEFASQGEMINNPKTILSGGQGAVSASPKELTWKMDKLLMDRIDPLLAAMHEWICDNKQHFPLYTCKQCKCKEDGISFERKSGFILGVYDCNNTKTCCDD